MQDAADKNPISVRAIDDHVLSLLNAPVPSSDGIASTSHLRRMNKEPEAILESIKIPLRLFQAPFVESVFGDLDQVQSRQARKPIGRQQLHYTRYQGSSADPLADLAHHIAIGDSAFFSG
jgi:hypothetical protein